MLSFTIELLENIQHIIVSAMRNWGSIHPVVIHLPIVLILLAPFFIFGSFIFPKSSRTLLISACVMMIFGSGSIFLATSTGDAAAEHLKPDVSVLNTLDEHLTLAEQARLAFSILTGVFSLFLGIKFLSSFKMPLFINNLFFICFLILYGYFLLVLFNAAHYGGKLVHEHGITSSLYESSGHH